MSALVLSFFVIFIAEFGDKSQLMALAFATRYGFWTVVSAITAATAFVHLFSVAIGGVLGAAIPREPVSIAAGVAFVLFGVWTLRGDELTDADEARSRRERHSAFWLVAVTFFLAELGDKTMLATITLATNNGWLGTWIGSTVGMVAADAVAIAAGAIIARRIPGRWIEIGAAALFFFFGAWLIAAGLH